MNWWKIGTHIWTACSAGWVVIGVVTNVPEAFLVSVGCLAMATFWHVLFVADAD